MDFQAEQAIQGELQPGERLLWTGSPRRGVRLVAADAFMIPFSLLWGGFALYWEYGVLQEGAPLFFAIWGVPFVLVGIYITVGRFFVDAYRRSRTRYALTDRRILIISESFGRRVDSINLATLSQLGLSVRSDRSGTITLGPPAGLHGAFAGSGWPGAGKHAPPRLEAVENVRDVHERILRAQQERVKI